MQAKFVVAAASAGLLAAAACSRTEPAKDATATVAPLESSATAPDTSGPLPFPMPINAVMVSLVDFAADGVWRPAASETPLTDKQWLLVQQDATNLIASASLITMAGTGVNDAEWVKDPDWRRWATEMQVTAEQAKAAADAKDQARLKLTGDRLVELCQTCHQKFKPGLPSMGITRFPIYPKRNEP